MPVLKSVVLALTLLIAAVAGEPDLC